MRPLLFDGFSRVARFALVGAMSLSPAETDDTLILEASPRRTRGGNFRFAERTQPLDVTNTYATLSRKIEVSRVEGRFAQGLRFFEFYEGERLVGSSWLVSGGPRFLDESGLEVHVEEDAMWIRDVFVDRTFRGKGFFGAMLDTLASEPFAHVTKILSDVAAQNDASLRAHYNYGFHSVARIHTIHVAGLAMRRSGSYEHLPELRGYKPHQRYLLTGPRFREFVRTHLA